jgi:hypothetical protein
MSISLGRQTFMGHKLSKGTPPISNGGSTVVKSFSKTLAIIIFHTFFGLHTHAQWEDSCREEKSSTQPCYSAYTENSTVAVVRPIKISTKS